MSSGPALHPRTPPPHRSHFRQALRCRGVRERMAAENEASQESALGAYSPVDYMSITSFPRLPEDEPAPAAPLRGRKDEDAFLGDPDTGEARWPVPAPPWEVPVLLHLCRSSTFSLHLLNSSPSFWTSPFSLVCELSGGEGGAFLPWRRRMRQGRRCQGLQ